MISELIILIPKIFAKNGLILMSLYDNVSLLSQLQLAEARPRYHFSDGSNIGGVNFHQTSGQV